MDYKHKSGAKKREEKKLKDFNTKKGQQTLDRFRVQVSDASEGTNIQMSTSKCVEDNEKSNQATITNVEIENEQEVDNFMTEGHVEHRSTEVQSESIEKLHTFDIGEIDSLYMTSVQVRDAIRQGPQPPPIQFPKDANGHCFPKSILQTRWSARVDCVKPFALHIKQLIKALDHIELLNLSSETRTEVNGIKTYMRSFECVLLATIWLKVLTAINHRSLVLQARNATLDVETANINSLISELKDFRNQWPSILNECKIVAENYDISNTFQEKRRKKRKQQFYESNEEEPDLSPETQFKQEVFYVLLDCLIGNMTRRFDALKEIDVRFGFLYKYQDMNEDDLKKQAETFCNIFNVDVSNSQLIEEIIHLKAIHEPNFGCQTLFPLQLINTLHQLKMEVLFPNICIALRIFCTIPVSVAEGERSFSLLSRIKNFLRSTMSQNRLTSLGTLALESEIARNINFDAVITTFAEQKARKVYF